MTYMQVTVAAAHLRGMESVGLTGSCGRIRRVSDAEPTTNDRHGQGAWQQVPGSKGRTCMQGWQHRRTLVVARARRHSRVLTCRNAAGARIMACTPRIAHPDCELHMLTVSGRQPKG